MSGQISFNGYDLQTTTSAASTILTRDILYRHLPEKIINLKQDTIRDGFDVLDIQYPSKTITLGGWLKSNSSTNLRTLIDNFKKNLREKEKNLDIGYGSGDIRYVCTLNSMNVPEEHWHITQVPYSCEFLCTPFGKATSTTTVNLNSGGAITANHNETITITGSYSCQPTITFTLAGTGITAMTALKFSNTTTSDWIEIARTFSASEVLIIDCENETVKVNGVAVDFAGVLPRFSPGSNATVLTVTATAFSLTGSIVYYPTYL